MDIADDKSRLMPTAVDSGQPIGVGKLLSSLLGSFLFCAFFALGGFLGAETLEAWIGWMIGWGAYWLLFVVLQVYWWRKGYAEFWRPLYAYTLLGFMATIVLPLLLLLVRPVRRWLSGKMKPYDPADSRARLWGPGKELDEAGWFLERGDLGQALKRIHLARKRALKAKNSQLLLDALSTAEALQPKTQGRLRRDSDNLIKALKTDLG